MSSLNSRRYRYSTSKWFSGERRCALPQSRGSTGNEEDGGSQGELISSVPLFAAFLATLFCASPAQILGRGGLGDVKRTQYQIQLDGAGPVELETAALVSVATNDFVLAAAIVTVIDRRPTERRPFPANGLAARLFGTEFKQVSAQLAGIQLALNTAAAANREFVAARLTRWRTSRTPSRPAPSQGRAIEIECRSLTDQIHDWQVIANIRTDFHVLRAAVPFSIQSFAITPDGKPRNMPSNGLISWSNR